MSVSGAVVTDDNVRRRPKRAPVTLPAAAGFSGSLSRAGLRRRDELPRLVGVPDFAVEPDPDPVVNPAPDQSYEGENIPGGRPPEVDDKIGVQRGNPCPSHGLPLEPRVLDDLPRWARELVNRRIVGEHGTAVRQVKGKFAPALPEDPDLFPPHRPRLRAPEIQDGAEDDPPLLRHVGRILEKGPPVGEAALILREGPPLPGKRDGVHRADVLSGAVSQAAAVHGDQSAEGAGNARRMLEAGQPCVGKVFHQLRHPDSTPGPHLRTGDGKVGEKPAQLHHHAPDAAVGEEQVRSLPYDKEGNILSPDKFHEADDLLLRTGLDQGVRRTPDLP
ncbi:hypothetical protein SDC9_42385 [bioreactor metagenome]|uniref:Uncharacterized protein n=1 Tax=bioreactor metagenome TaxID=1076179 RepID=A0A644VYI9_9ZZZZ